MQGNKTNNTIDNLLPRCPLGLSRSPSLPRPGGGKLRGKHKKCLPRRLTNPAICCNLRDAISIISRYFQSSETEIMNKCYLNMIRDIDNFFPQMYP